jgi:hypothetical protein
MKILIEGQSYRTTELEHLIGNPQFYISDGDFSIINHVGYSHSLDTKEVIYFLPKVFIINKQLFGKYELEDNKPFCSNENIELSNNSWLGKLLLLFYSGISEYKRRNPNSKIIESSDYYQLSSNLGSSEYSYLDICLDILNFYKIEKEKILFRNAKRKSSYSRKMNWTRTISRQTPIVDTNGSPVYTILESKKKQVDTEDVLLTIFYSILTKISGELGRNLSLTINYPLYRDSKFTWLEKNGFRLLKKIKYNYFTDDLKKIYHLCLLFLEKKYSGNIRRKKQEFIAIRDYNIVFEDMVDKLFTDTTILNYEYNNITISDLKKNKDGKIIDHIFKFDSIIDDNEILYIGDSKYYKPDAKAGKLSIYKQFTYAKNVVQFNIDLLKNPSSDNISGVKYFDYMTEGYNITPNFLLYAFIPFDNEMDCLKLDYLKSYIQDHSIDGLPKSSCHFFERLFDRDTLFVHEYQINFLFVLHSYCMKSTAKLISFRGETKEYFRDKLKNYFKDKSKSGFEFRTKEFDSTEEMAIYINDNFRLLLGKVISTSNTTLLLAVNIAYAKENENLSTISREFTNPYSW